MFRAITLLSTPLVTAGLVYWLGWMAIAGCVALVFGALLFSTNAGSEQRRRVRSEDSEFSYFGPPTTRIANL
ncbi:MAG: hypothetical protein ABWZ88_10145 [Variovorax sp.]